MRQVPPDRSSKINSARFRNYDEIQVLQRSKIVLMHDPSVIDWIRVTRDNVIEQQTPRVANKYQNHTVEKIGTLEHLTLARQRNCRI